MINKILATALAVAFVSTGANALGDSKKTEEKKAETPAVASTMPKATEHNKAEDTAKKADAPAAKDHVAPTTGGAHAASDKPAEEKTKTEEKIKIEEKTKTEEKAKA